MEKSSRAKNRVAPICLRNLHVNVIGCWANQIKNFVGNSNAMFEAKSIYVGRTFGRDCDHRNFGGIAATSGAGSS